MTNPFFSELALHVERSAAAAGYNVILGNSDNSADRQSIIFARSRCVASTASFSCRRARSTLHLNSKFQLSGWIEKSSGGQFVASDNRAGAKSAIEYLHRLGHRLIACVAGPKDLPNAQERRMGYEDVALPILRSAGVDPSAYIVSADFSYDSGYAAARRLMEVAPRPTAIFASSDQQAIGGLRAAADLGLAVPGDLSIVGFDDIPLANLVMPRLTTVGQPVAKIGVLAMQLLLDLFSGAAAPRRRRHLLATSLQIRQSCAPPNADSAASARRNQEASLQPALRGGQTERLVGKRHIRTTKSRE